MPWPQRESFPRVMSIHTTFSYQRNRLLAQSDVLFCVMCIDIAFWLSWMISSTSYFINPYEAYDH